MFFGRSQRRRRRGDEPSERPGDPIGRLFEDGPPRRGGRLGTDIEESDRRSPCCRDADDRRRQDCLRAQRQLNAGPDRVDDDQRAFHVQFYKNPTALPRIVATRRVFASCRCRN
jgi:hypothetical protein